MGVISEEFFPTPYSVVMKMIEPYGYNLNKRSVLERSCIAERIETINLK